jgi:penicillin amidase
MVVDWGTSSFSGIYPGGQSENPASCWYVNRADAWWNGKYAPMLSAPDAASASGTITWRLE